MQEGKFAEAINHFRKALQIQPDFEMAENNLKNALAMKRDLELEEKRVQQSLKHDPDNPELHFQMGNLSFRKGALSDAIGQYKKTLQLQPQFVPALNNLALVYARQKDYAQALASFMEVLKHKPDDAEIHYNIACMYSRLKRVNASIDWLQKAIDKGYANWENIKNDNDLDNIRESSAYKELIQGH
jgi:tetratricopeptide (TPR) repeat protein